MSVSVVMGVYNGVASLVSTLRSIQEQTLDNFEIIIVNDGSDLDTRALLDKLASQDGRIVVFNKAQNEGLTRALVDGCSIARGHYIARIDNGDLMVPKERIALQAAILDQYPEIAVVGGKIEVHDLLNGHRYLTRPPLTDKAIRKRMQRTSPFAHVSVMFRKDIYERCGGYDPARHTGQDSDLWPRMLMHGQGMNMDIPLAVAKMSPDSISVRNNRAQILDAAARNWRAFLGKPNEVMRVPVILGYLVKLMLPLRLRVRLRYLRNAEFLGGIGEERQVVTPLEQRHRTPDGSSNNADRGSTT